MIKVIFCHQGVRGVLCKKLLAVSETTCTHHQLRSWHHERSDKHDLKEWELGGCITLLPHGYTQNASNHMRENINWRSSGDLGLLRQYGRGNITQLPEDILHRVELHFIKKSEDGPERNPI